MGEEQDWRLQGQAKYLQGLTLAHQRYRQNAANPRWDHDHCEFCWAKFMVEGMGTPDTLHQGYASENDYWWICERCFADFKDRFGWQVVERLA